MNVNAYYCAECDATSPGEERNYTHFEGGQRTAPQWLPFYARLLLQLLLNDARVNSDRNLS